MPDPPDLPASPIAARDFLEDFVPKAFAAFAARVPTFAALKATYLLALSVPFGVFVVRAIESLEATSGRWARPLVAAAVLPAPIVASLVFALALGSHRKI